MSITCAFYFDGTTTLRTIPVLINSFIIPISALGIGIDPSYQLQLSTDSAAKPSSSTWTVTSDARLKTEIKTADYDRCYEIVQGLDLRSYCWDSNIPGLLESVGHDRRRLGWIAQEVEPLFPKAVHRLPEQYGLSNVLNVNFDQLYAVQYGAVKKLIQLVYDMEEATAELPQLKATVSHLEQTILQMEADMANSQFTP